MAGRMLTPDEVLARIPQQEPFRFIDEILELDDEHIVGELPLARRTPTSTAATSPATR